VRFFDALRGSAATRDQKKSAPRPSIQVEEASERVPTRAPDVFFAEIFEQHARYLWRALRGLGVREGDVDDACQEVLLVVHRRLAQFESGSLRSWLYGICLRVASEYRRSARVRREIPVLHVPEDAQPAAQIETIRSAELRDRLFDALETLDDDKRAAFVLYEIEELTLREVAEALSCPVQTAYSRLQAARAHVRQHFAGNRRSA